MFLVSKQRLIALTTICSLLAAGGLAVPPLQAQTAPASPSTNPTPIATLDTFLDAHPAIEKDLEQNPKLLNDATYLSKHPELKSFLDSHTAVSTAAAKNPKALMNRLEKFEKSGRDIPKADLAAFDNFMDQHSSIEKDVRKDPTLLTNANYLAQHPELKSFLAAHPGIQQEITEHPCGFMNAERHFEHAEDKVEHPQQAKLDHKPPTPPPVPPHPMGPHK